LQAGGALKLFRREHGREASSTEEMGAWAGGSLPRQPIDSFEVLSDEQSRAVVERH